MVSTMKRRFHVGLDLLKLGEQLAILGCGDEFPVDDALGSLVADEEDFPEIVLLVEATTDVFEGAFLSASSSVLFQASRSFSTESSCRLRNRRAWAKIELGNEFGDLLVAQTLVDLVEEAEIFLELRP